MAKIWSMQPSKFQSMIEYKWMVCFMKVSEQKNHLSISTEVLNAQVLI